MGLGRLGLLVAAAGGMCLVQWMMGEKEQPPEQQEAKEESEPPSPEEENQEEEQVQLHIPEAPEGSEAQPPAVQVVVDEAEEWANGPRRFIPPGSGPITTPAQIRQAAVLRRKRAALVEMLNSSSIHRSRRRHNARGPPGPHQ